MMSKNLEATLYRSFEIANKYNHKFAILEHLLLALLKDEEVKSFFKELNIDIIGIENEVTNFLQDEELESISNKSKLQGIIPARGIQRVLQQAVANSSLMGCIQISSLNLLAEIFSERYSFATSFLESHGIARMDVINYIVKNLDTTSHAPDNLFDKTTTHNIEPIKSNKSNDSNNNPLSLYCIDLNVKALKGQIDNLIGREHEVQRTIEVLCRRHKNNPLLIGEPGVGKTAIVEGIAYKIINGEVPKVLSNCTIYSLDIGSLVAGTRYRGDFEERMKSVIKALKEMPSAILFIDEIHTIIGAGSTSGGSLDASNLLKPSLARGEIRCIGSTTFKEYHQHFEKDMALVRRFQNITVEEPTVEKSIEILHGLKEYYQRYHNVLYEDEALEAAVLLSERYIAGRKLPDKAIDVIDEAGARKKVISHLSSKKDIVGIKDIEDVVSRISSVPSLSFKAHELSSLKNLENNLKEVIFGQNQAIEQVCSTIRIAKAGLRNVKKPTASYLFTGATGVGKTELAKQLANFCNMNFLRFDMSEYAEQHSVSRLIGTPPGYVGFDQGGLLTNAVSQNPYSIVLFDEIEKAHGDIYNLMLQIMDYGKLTDSNGKVINFCHTIIIMTSNFGSEYLNKEKIGFDSIKPSNIEAWKEVITTEFKPEFCSRLDGVIHFNPISYSIIELIIDKHIDELEDQLNTRNIKIQIANKAKKYIADIAFKNKNGARVIEKIILDEIKKNIADEILFGKLNKGGTVKVGYNSKLNFKYDSILKGILLKNEIENFSKSYNNHTLL